MIQILNEHICCGCNACVQRCPKQCISMQMDEKGFLYPKVDLGKCIDCHLCEEVCTCLNQEAPQKPILCYAAKNTDESIRQHSSSGGVFTSIAEKVIDEKGVVFGACFDACWQVVHTCVETKPELVLLRGAKYVQSRVGDSFRQVEQFLKARRKVLFSGTPCQVSGLNRYLRKEYDNLLTVEVVCHGVPSPKIWQEYLESLNLMEIGHISHKDKTSGWRGYSFTVKDTSDNVIFTERASDNKYMIAFIRNLILRPSCFHCPAKSGKSKADITIADYWGIENIMPNMDDDKGVSFICVNTPKGETLIRKLRLQMQQVDYQESIQYNSCIFKSTGKPREYQRFWRNYKRQGIQAILLLKRRRPNLFKQIFKWIFR